MIRVLLLKRVYNKMAVMSQCQNNILNSTLTKAFTTRTTAMSTGYAALVSMLSDTVKLKSVEQGAATSVWVAVSGSLEGIGGLYLEDCGISEIDDTPGAQTGYSSWVTDPVAAADLWKKSGMAEFAY